MEISSFLHIDVLNAPPSEYMQKYSLTTGLVFELQAIKNTIFAIELYGEKGNGCGISHIIIFFS